MTGLWKLSVCAVFWLTWQPAAYSQETGTAGRLLVVHRITSLSVVSAGTRIPICRLGPRTRLRTIPLSGNADTQPADSGHYRYVTTLDPCCRLIGWVNRSAIVDIRELRESVQKSARTGLDRVDPGKPALPALVRRQPVEIQQTWRELSNLIAQNQELPVEERLPDPLLSRALLGSVIGAHDEALRDYVRAGDIITEGALDSLTWAGHLKQLQDGLKNYDRAPAPAYLGEALEHWETGRNAWIHADLRLSIREFSDAIALNPERPLYWYERAMTYRLIGAHDEAARDARIGVYHEQKLRREDRRHPWVRELPDRLERIQGPRRFWLEEYRRGSSDVWLMQLMDRT